MTDGFVVLDEQIAKLENLDSFVRDAAPEVADVISDELNSQIAAGKSPDGQMWKLRKDDGGKPLRNAAQALTVVPVRMRIFCRLKGPEARHSRGIALGGTVRQVLPTILPLAWATKIKFVMVNRFKKVMGV